MDRPDRQYPIPDTEFSLDLIFSPGPLAIPPYPTRTCLHHFLSQIWEEDPDALVTKSKHQTEKGIDVSIRPTKLSSYHGLLYGEVELAMTTLMHYVDKEDLYYVMTFNLYQTVASGTIWQMEGMIRQVDRGFAVS